MLTKSSLWATATPTAAKLPISDGDGKLANGWLAANLAAIAALANAAGALTNDGFGGLTWSTSSSGGVATATAALDFGDEGAFATVEVTHAGISPTSSIVTSISGANAEEALVLGMTVAVLAQSTGSCIIAGSCENGASGIFNVTLLIA